MHGFLSQYISKFLEGRTARYLENRDRKGRKEERERRRKGRREGWVGREDRKGGRRQLNFNFIPCYVHYFILHSA